MVRNKYCGHILRVENAITRQLKPFTKLIANMLLWKLREDGADVSIAENADSISNFTDSTVS
jgi:hypothetical protein